MSGSPRRSVADGSRLTVGAHLPHTGSAACAENLATAGKHLEDLGFACGWASDHIVVQEEAEFPPTAYFYDPLASLTWVAANTSRLELGTSVLVVPLRRPTLLAKMLASIDLLSGGRLVVGVGGGYVEPEFQAAGVPFAERGRRTDEAIEMLRRLWAEDPIGAEFPVHGVRFANVRMKPQPRRHLPIWVGGDAPPALRRAARLGDGWHGLLRTTDDPDEELTRALRSLREARPEEGFVLSIRAMWDGLEDDHDAMLRTIERLRDLGVSHVAVEPRQRTLDGYRRSTQKLAEVFNRAGAAMAG